MAIKKLKEGLNDQATVKDVVDTIENMIDDADDTAKKRNDTLNKVKDELSDLMTEGVHDIMNFTVFSEEYDEGVDIEAHDAKEAIASFKHQYGSHSGKITKVHDENGDEYCPETGKMISEGYDGRDWSVKNVSFDVAVKDADLGKFSGSGMRAGNAFHTAFDHFLQSQGMELAGDLFEVRDADTKAYIDNDYEFFTESKSINEEYAIFINDEVHCDDFGEPYHFSSRDDAEEFIEDNELENAEIVRQYGKAKNESKSIKESEFDYDENSESDRILFDVIGMEIADFMKSEHGITEFVAEENELLDKAVDLLVKIVKMHKARGDK